MLDFTGSEMNLQRSLGENSFSPQLEFWKLNFGSRLSQTIILPDNLGVLPDCSTVKTSKIAARYRNGR